LDHFADIILPFSVKGRFTYGIPENLNGKIHPGMRVKVQFGSRNILTGIVADIHNKPPEAGKTRDIIQVMDEIPVITGSQLKLWQWIAEYYMCTEGEVMKAALPSDKSINEYKPRQEVYIELASLFSDSELNAFLDKLVKAPKQYDILSKWIEITGYTSGSEIIPVNRSILLNESHSSAAALEGLCRKGILKLVNHEVSRLKQGDIISQPPGELSPAQLKAFDSIKIQAAEKDIILLHGVTSSGKTEIYIHLIEEQLKQGKQVLYMLPEIALTTQIIHRLEKHFGGLTGVYHSRFNDNERVEIWKKVAEEDPGKGYRLILGVRSSVFLPFRNLGLVIIDEEHDSSYKQQDPSPRYHARDTAIVLARIHGAKTILGSASPSVESYYNAFTGKYGLAELNERYGKIKLPDIVIANTREAYRRKAMVSHFTPELLFAIDNALTHGEQVILFQNRRGFSPYIQCQECGWIPTCIACAVNLTYHKGINRLVCHYCGYTVNLPHQCGNCSSTGLSTIGFGTEKIEDEIRIVFPKARVARMDQDTTRGKNSFDKIIKSFEDRDIDILIGTQMISKGLDFENLTIVGILNADNLLNFPDFRAHERSFQLMEQVSGRAGRRAKQGKVVIQTSDPVNRIIRLVIRHDYLNLFKFQVEERKMFNYPPFCRIIKITIKHRDRALLNDFAEILGQNLRTIFGKRVLGPEEPLISRIQLWYLKTILLKIEKDKSSSKAKQMILQSIGALEKEKGASGLRIAIDVDPY
jgi:primosomal protein N' (replication factor Y)